MTQRILTIYGQRGWNTVDPDYCAGSFWRGIKFLNYSIQELANKNPQINIESISHTHTIIPNYDSSSAYLMMYATVVLTGKIEQIPNTWKVEEEFGGIEHQNLFRMNL